MEKISSVDAKWDGNQLFKGARMRLEDDIE
jgi:hypothetical protein